MMEEICQDVEGSVTIGEHEGNCELSGEKWEDTTRTGKIDTIVVIVEICEITKIVHMIMFQYLAMQSTL